MSESINDRVCRLERENRWMKRVGLSVIVCMSGVLLMGQVTERKIVRANEFILRGEDGKELAVLKEFQKEPLFLMKDVNGDGAAYIQVQGGNATMGLSNAESKTEVLLSAQENYAGMALKRSRGDMAMEAAVNDGKAGMKIFGVEKKVVWEAPEAE